MLGFVFELKHGDIEPTTDVVLIATWEEDRKTLTYWPEPKAKWPIQMQFTCRDYAVSFVFSGRIPHQEFHDFRDHSL